MTTPAPPSNLLDVLAFGELLQHYIEHAGFKSKTAFADAAGTTATTVVDCISGKMGPPIDQLERWCDALKLRGKPREEFIHSGWRSKAWFQKKANPWLNHVERQLAKSKRHLRSAREFIEWQIARIAQLEEAMKQGGVLPPRPVTDPPELPSLDDAPEP